MKIEIIETSEKTFNVKLTENKIDIFSHPIYGKFPEATLTAINNAINNVLMRYKEFQKKQIKNDY